MASNISMHFQNALSLILDSKIGEERVKNKTEFGWRISFVCSDNKDTMDETWVGFTLFHNTLDKRIIY